MNMMRVACYYSALVGITEAAGARASAALMSELTLEQADVVPQSYGTELTNGNNVMYTANVGIGSPPQYAKMIFDTGSSHFWVNSELCTLQVCEDKNQFRFANSSSFMQSHKRSRDVTYGAGYVRMVYGNDKVWLGGKELPKHELIGLAYEMDASAFTDLPNDGIIGLGPIDGLSMSERPESLLWYLKDTKSLPQNIFSVYFTSGNANALDNKGWIEFGDVPKRYMANPDAELSWVPIKKGGKWWEMKLMDVYVGQKSTGYCRRHRCSAVADTGSTDIAVPAQDYALLQRQIRTNYDCSNNEDIPPLTFIFEMDNGKTARLTVPGKQFLMQYTSKTGHTHCESYLRSLPQAFATRSTYILGMPFLRTFLSVYDFENDRVGFTLANQNPVEPESQSSIWESVKSFF